MFCQLVSDDTLVPPNFITTTGEPGAMDMEDPADATTLGGAPMMS